MNPTNRVLKPWQRDLLYCAIAVLAAILVRVVFYFQYMTTLPYATVPVNDARMYWNFGLELYRNGWMAWDSGAYYQAPLYSFFLALLHYLGFHRVVQVLFAQMLLGIANTALCYGIARFYVSSKFSLLAVLLFTFTHLSFFFETKLLGTTLGLTLWLGYSLVFLQWLKRPNMFVLLLSALLLGLSILCRPNMLFTFVYLPFFFMAFSHRQTSWIKTIQTIRFSWQGWLFLGTVVLVLFSATLRNYAVSGEWVFISANSGVTLYMGNNPDAIGGLAPVAGLSNDIEKQQTEMVTLASSLAGEELTPNQASKFWVKQTVQYVWEHPISWLTLEIKKLFWAFYHSPPAVNYSLHFEADWLPMLYGFLWMNGLVLALGLMALCFGWNMQSNEHRFLLVQILGYMTLVLVYYSSDRFLVTVMPFFAIAAALGFSKLDELRERFSTKRFRFTVVCIAILAIVFNPFFLSYAKTERAYGWYNLGVMAEEQTVAAGAETCYETALSIEPDHPDALLNLGVLYAKANRLLDSNRLFERLLTIVPGHETALRNLAINYRRQGRDDEAKRLLERIAR